VQKTGKKELQNVAESSAGRTDSYCDCSRHEIQKRRGSASWGCATECGSEPGKLEAAQLREIGQVQFVCGLQLFNLLLRKPGSTVAHFVLKSSKDGGEEQNEEHRLLQEASNASIDC
jgi:hypothetical protein